MAGGGEGSLRFVVSHHSARSLVRHQDGTLMGASSATEVLMILCNRTSCYGHQVSSNDRPNVCCRVTYLAHYSVSTTVIRPHAVI